MSEHLFRSVCERVRADNAASDSKRTGTVQVQPLVVTSYLRRKKIASEVSRITFIKSSVKESTDSDLFAQYFLTSCSCYAPAVRVRASSNLSIFISVVRCRY